MTKTHRICPSSDIAEEQSKEVLIDRFIIAVFRHSGSLYAMDGMCLHQGGPIARGTVKDGCVTCPWHGWQYHLDTGNNAATGKPMLSSYSIRDRDGWIEIELPEA